MIRTLTLDEYPQLRKFLHLAIHVPGGSLPPESILDTDPMLRGYWDGFGSRVGDVAVAAERDRRLVGIAWSRICNDPTGYGHLDDKTPELGLAVLPEVRGVGIGTALLTELLARLRDEGFTRTSLSVDKNNPEARRLYERLGFRVVAGQDDETRTDLVLAADLEDPGNGQAPDHRG